MKSCVGMAVVLVLACARLGGESPGSAVTEQRGRARAASAILQAPFSSQETTHFIIHHTGGELPAGTEGFVESCLFTSLARLFDAESSGSSWLGRVVVFVLADREELRTFARGAHSFADRRSAYFRATGDQAELVLARDSGPERFFQDFAHETTHLLLHYYTAPHHAPNWLHEGLAQFMEFRLGGTSRARSDSLGRIRRDLVAGVPMSLSELIAGDRPRTPSDLAGYAYAWALVEFLQTRHPEKTAEFVRRLKTGEPSTRTFRYLFGDFGTLEDAWDDYLRGID